MNAVAVMYVNEHLADLRAEASEPSIGPLVEKRSLRARIASAHRRSPQDPRFRAAGPVVPQLKNYPYGG